MAALVKGNELTLMVQPDGRVWIDADSMVDYFRRVEAHGHHHSRSALAAEDYPTYAAAYGTAESIRQIADSLILTMMEAREEVGSRRGSR